MNFVVFDFETANEKRDSACAIGLTRVKDGVICETVHHLIRPVELRFSAWNTRLHGITHDDVVNSPSLGQLWPHIVGYFESELVVAHSATFDISVLRHSLHAVGLPVPRLHYLCSVQLSCALWPELTSHSLGFLAEVHGVPLEHHHAGSDSLATANLVLIGSREKNLTCLRELAAHCRVSIGEVLSHEEWTPSSAPGIRRGHVDVEIEIPEGFDTVSHPFYQKTIVFTGKMRAISRKNAERIVEQFGGYPGKSVTQNTNYLVTGYQDIRMLARGTNESAKLRKAKQLRAGRFDLQVISENDFAELIFNPMDNGCTNDQ